MNWGDLRRALYRCMPWLAQREEQRVLAALAAGWMLRSHRGLDGTKAYRLHALSGEERSVSPQVVEELVAQGLIQSNQKFPVATYLLTERGRRVVRVHGAPGPNAAP